MARLLPGDNNASTKGASRTGGSREVSVEEDNRKPVRDYYLIKKPFLTVMTMMELFKEERFDVRGMDDAAFPNAGAIVSRNIAGDEVIALYNKPDLYLRANQFNPTMDVPDLQKHLLESQGVRLALKLKGLTKDSYNLIRYRFDESYNASFPSSGIDFVILAADAEELKRVEGLSYKICSALNSEDMVMLTGRELLPGVCSLMKFSPERQMRLYLKG